MAKAEIDAERLARLRVEWDAQEPPVQEDWLWLLLQAEGRAESLDKALMWGGMVTECQQVARKLESERDAARRELPEVREGRETWAIRAEAHRQRNDIAERELAECRVERDALRRAFEKWFARAEAAEALCGTALAALRDLRTQYLLEAEAAGRLSNALTDGEILAADDVLATDAAQQADQRREAEQAEAKLADAKLADAEWRASGAIHSMTALEAQRREAEVLCGEIGKGLQVAVETLGRQVNLWDNEAEYYSDAPTLRQNRRDRASAVLATYRKLSALLATAAAQE